VTLQSQPAISVRQPWAELIMRGTKTIEIRSWDAAHRGEVWIHAGKKMDPLLALHWGIEDPFRGGFVGMVTVTAIVPLDARRWAAWRSKHLDAGDYSPGTFAWVLATPRRLATPVPEPGQLGLFHPSSHAQALLAKAEFVEQ